MKYRAPSGTDIKEIKIEGPVSRPLSPISESGSPFIPDGTVAIIDLISEPSSSPKSVHLATQTVARHSRDLSNSNMVKNFKGTKMTSVTVNDRNKSELPVFSTTGLPNLTSGDLKALPLAHKQLDQALGNIDNSGAGHEGGQFDEVISEIVEPTHHHSPPMVEQEHHSGLRTLTRLPVPSMPFHVAPAPWTTHVSSARIQFDWIIGNQLQSTRSLDVTGEEQEAHLSLELDVDVSAIDTYRRLLDEDAIFSQQNVSLNFDADLESTFESRNESSLTLPFILQLADEPDVGEPPSSPDIAKSMTISPQLKPKYEESPFFGSKKAATCAQTRDKSEALDALPLLSNGNAIGDLLPRRDSENNPLGALPLSNDDETTAKLLLSYMELRAVKTRRLDKGAPRTKQVTSSVTMEPPQQRPENNSPKVEEAAISAYSPKLQIPIIMGVFIISHNLPRPILRHLESVWPPDHILDRDYTAHNNVTTPAAAGLLESKTLSAYEADISLTPVVGVVITNLIKVGQKPLPGSKALPELRERIARVSLKYETLVILVSECNPLGEYCGHSNAAEMTAFDDFVRFTSELQQGIAVHFLHGAFKTAANWALDLMCRNSSIAASFKSYLSNMESAWELHLRRAGLNAFAAQVLAGVLFEEMGDAGLARFAAMSAQERVSRFSQLLGGSKGLLHVRPVCDL
jgi:hypothetical protein